MQSNCLQELMWHLLTEYMPVRRCMHLVEQLECMVQLSGVTLKLISTHGGSQDWASKTEAQTLHTKLRGSWLH